MSLLRPNLTPDEIFLDGDDTHYVNGKGKMTVPACVADSVSNQLSADVAMTLANTAYDGPSVTLTPGTWLLIGTVTVLGPAGASKLTAKLWDGTTVESSSEQALDAATAGSITLVGIVTLTPTSVLTYKITCLNTVAAGTIKAAAPDNAAGNTASTLVAMRIA